MPTVLMKNSICFFLMFLYVLCYGQNTELYQKTFTKLDGVDIDNISTISYDNNGFLWLGGSNLDNRSIILSDKKLALQRFNGQTFHNIELPIFKNRIEDVEHIYKRKDGKFYLSTKLIDGYRLFLFDPYVSSFESINFSDYGEVLSGLSKVFSFKEEDYILIQKENVVSLRKITSDLTSKELFNFTSTENKYVIENSSRITPFEDFVIISDDNFNSKVFDWNGDIIQEIKTVETRNEPHPKRITIDEVFTENISHYLFLRNLSSLYKIDEKEKNIVLTKKNSLPNTHLNTYNDGKGNAMLFASKGDSLSFSTLEDNLIKTNYKIKVNVTNGIKIASKDLKNEFWFTAGGSLHYFKLPNNVIKNFMPNYQFRDIKPLDSVNYLVSTETQGWFTINVKDEIVTPYNIKFNNTSAKFPSRNLIIEDSVIWSNGNAGIIKVNTKNRTVENYRHYPIQYLEKPNDSLIVYGTNRYSLGQFNTKTKTHSILLKTDTLNISDIHILKNESLVVAATDKGLLTYDLASKKHKFYDNKNDLEDTYLITVEYHKDYGYLLGSRSGIIYAFNPESESFTTLYKDDLQAGIATILFDDDTWWINTFNGYIAYHIKNKSKIRLSEKDGFSHFEANRYSALKTDNGFFVGSVKGLNYFNSKSLKKKNDSASLVLLRIKAFDSDEKKYREFFNRVEFDNQEYINLPTENRALELDFALKNTNSVDKGYSFKYRLNNKDWVNLKQQNNIQFPNLAAGDYTLEIEALDFSGNKVGDSLFIQIKSNEFFYKTWWFIALVSAFIISILLYLLRQFQLRKKLQDQFSLDLIQSQEDERKRIASELHDSVSQQLTLIKRRAQNNKQHDISELTNNTLEEVRHISRGLFPPLLKQLGLTESIEQLALDIDENNDIFVTTEIDTIDKFLDEDQSLHLYRFIQECINNILKHSEAKAFSINIVKEKTLILIKIKDNGKGFNVGDAKIKNSLGLKTIEERIRFVKGELSIESSTNKGTTIKAKIPV